MAWLPQVGREDERAAGIWLPSLATLTRSFVAAHAIAHEHVALVVGVLAGGEQLLASQLVKAT